MNTIRAVIFDLDGTITEPFFDFDAIREEIGMDRKAGPILEAMETMTPHQRQRTEEILKKHEDLAVEQSTLNPTTRETLEALSHRGIRIGILTRNTRDNALAISSRHNLRFDAIVDRQAGPVKPDPFGVLHICRMFHIQPDQALVVGDFLFDLLCANNAGAISVLLQHDGRNEEFKQYAAYTIRRLEEVLKIMDTINNNGK
ncbi:MAG: HAD family hydrolase [Sedimentisphaerales bacterium]|nr:HAD family hydrolase [Sedimentisphaerales bacterium]